MFIGAFKCAFNQHDGYQHDTTMFAGGKLREWVSHVKVLKNKWSDGVAREWTEVETMSVAEVYETAIEEADSEEDSTTTSMCCDSRIDYCERIWRKLQRNTLRGTIGGICHVRIPPARQKLEFMFRHFVSFEFSCVGSLVKGIMSTWQSVVVVTSLFRQCLRDCAVLFVFYSASSEPVYTREGFRWRQFWEERQHRDSQCDVLVGHQAWC